MNLTTATPVEIDTEIQRLEAQAAAERVILGRTIEKVHEAAGDKYTYNPQTRRHSWGMDVDGAIEAAKAISVSHAARYRVVGARNALDLYQSASDTVAHTMGLIKPLAEEYRRRPWTRAFLVTNVNGHVHSSRDCSTCYYTTPFQWMVAYSGKDEAEIVADAGYRACTVCYPSAPVGDAVSLPTKMFSDEEKTKAEAKAEREAAAADRLAKKIAKGLTADGSEFRCEWLEKDAPAWERDAAGQSVRVLKDRINVERFKTEVAAVQWVVQERAWDTRDLEAEKPAIDAIVAAVAKKHGKTVEQVEAEIAAKVAAKKKRDALR